MSSAQSFLGAVSRHQPPAVPTNRARSLAVHHNQIEEINMKTLSVILRTPIHKGSRRPLTPSECKMIKNQNTSVRPYPGKTWSINRDDDGRLSLRIDLRDGGASWAVDEATPPPAVDPCDFPQESAVARAASVASESAIPQTVYSNQTSGGWWHTNFLANLLRDSTVFVTMLPINYFC
jgi:hypothetical protein